MAGGGFYSEMKKVVDRLDTNDLDCYYATATDGSALEGFPPEKCIFISKTTHFSTRSFLARVRDFFRSTMDAYGLISRLKPDVIVGVSTSMLVPLFLCSLGSGSKRIFIESLTRVEDLSRTGKIVYRFRLSSRFYVQWPNLAEKYPRCVYEGKVL